MNGVGSVAIVTPFYPPHVGGVERYAQEFARAAVTMGVRVTIVTTDNNAHAPTEIEEEGSIRVLRLPAKYVPIMGSHYPVALKGWKTARNMLQCDVVMAHTRFFMTTFAAALASSRLGTRLAIVDHGAGPLRTSPRAMALAALGYEHAATAVLKRFGPRFFAVSDASARWLRRFGIVEAQVLPNSVAPCENPPCRNADSLQNRTVIFYGGRLLPEKGVMELIDAIALLAQRGHDVELRIAGDGPLAATINASRSQHHFLKYLGRIEPQRIEDELRRATVLVNPSNLPEGLPTILVEAGRAALPVISTPFGGSAEIIRDGSTGWIIPSGSPKVIADALEAVAAQRSEAVRRGMELFRLVQSGYTWPVTVRKFLACMSDSISKNPAVSGATATKL
jgi:glycosyltransferase involved in cell wall biosynthesis